LPLAKVAENIKTLKDQNMKRLLYWLLKKDMIKRLKQKHGEQFVDDVMETFGMPTNFMSKDLKQKNIDLAAEEVADSVQYDVGDVLTNSN